MFLSKRPARTRAARILVASTVATAAVLVTLLLPAPALAFDPALRMRVVQGAGGDFTVQYESQARLTDYWCTAGRYVTDTLGMPDRTRVFRLSPPPRRAGQGIAFTLDAARSAGETGISTFGGPQDGSMSAGGAAAQFCYSFDEDF